MISRDAPLAERMRPRTLADFTGQQHLIGEGAVLAKSLASGHIPSLILWGPPGVGKTTLAGILAGQLQRPFYALSAINSGVKDIREVIEKARKQDLFNNRNPILFIDEIHRFSKSQQDSLLEAVEKGWVTLIGATTENPSFEVISALLSRCQVYILKSLEPEQLLALLDKAVKEDAFLGQKKIVLAETEALIRLSGGDARKLLNVFELLIEDTEQEQVITNELVLSRVQQNLALYDKAGEQHYDIISAFIKSIRGSDPNAGIYWLARMLTGGEDPKFIARRLLILAAEDIGNANPQALQLASDCFRAVEIIGLPEARIILAQTVTYLASSPKSNAAYEAIGMAMQFVKESGDLPVPLHLRNAPTTLMKDIGYGEDYKYSHSYPGNFIKQEFLPDTAEGKQFYSPGQNKLEQAMRIRLRELWQEKYGY